jgi:hypothetical protein
MFGIQVAGGYANRMVPCAELIRKEIGSQGVDFVDVNLVCLGRWGFQLSGEESASRRMDRRGPRRSVWLTGDIRVVQLIWYSTKVPEVPVSGLVSSTCVADR